MSPSSCSYSYFIFLSLASLVILAIIAAMTHNQHLNWISRIIFLYYKMLSGEMFAGLLAGLD